MCFLKHSPLYLNLFYVCVCVFMFVCVWSSSAYSIECDQTDPSPWHTCRHTYTVHVHIYEEFALSSLSKETAPGQGLIRANSGIISNNSFSWHYFNLWNCDNIKSECFTKFLEFDLMVLEELTAHWRLEIKLGYTIRNRVKLEGLSHLVCGLQ